MSEKEIKEIISRAENFKVLQESLPENERNFLDKIVIGLLDLYKQQKEKNKELEEKLKIAVAILTKGTYPEENEGDNVAIIKEKQQGDTFGNLHKTIF